LSERLLPLGSPRHTVRLLGSPARPPRPLAPSRICRPLLPRPILAPRSQARLYGITAARRCPVHALVPSCGEHRGRDAKGRRRPKPLHEKPTPTPSRTPLHESRGNHPCYPTLLHARRRAESGDSTSSAHRIAPPKNHRGPQIARNHGPFHARGQIQNLIQNRWKTLRKAVEYGTSSGSKALRISDVSCFPAQTSA
jgi:hypothetical protein